MGQTETFIQIKPELSRIYRVVLLFLKKNNNKVVSSLCLFPAIKTWSLSLISLPSHF